MVDNKPIMEHIQEIIRMCQDIVENGEPMTENFQASTIIGWLPLPWKEYGEMLKHKRHLQFLDELLQHIQIEEQAWIRDKLEESQKEVSN